MEHKTRIRNLQIYLKSKSISLAIISDNVNLFYYTGQIVGGYLLIPCEGLPIIFSRRNDINKDFTTINIRKVENIAEYIMKEKLQQDKIGLCEDYLYTSEYKRICAMFENSDVINITGAVRLQRSIKSDFEIEQIRQCAKVHSEAYEKIPSLYREGMTDIDFSIEIEHTIRKMGHLGIFRTFGGKMEAFMGSILAGDNANTISPYDFALGGGGHPSLPIGANGTVIQEGMTVMVDVSCNINGYITDMTRTFYKGDLSKEAYTAHNVSIEIQNVLCEMLLNSTGDEMYLKSVEIAKSYGLEHCYMGSEIQAKFVGHGMGLEINELPVIAPRSGTILPNTVLALEPKFVIKGVGAVGTENTYLVTENKVEKLTTAEERLIKL